MNYTVLAIFSCKSKVSIAKIYCAEPFNATRNYGMLENKAQMLSGNGRYNTTIKLAVSVYAKGGGSKAKQSSSSSLFSSLLFSFLGWHNASR